MAATPITRLDNRGCLLGEPRLSDAQVRCLRDASDAPLRHVRAGWVSGGRSEPAHGQQTVTALINLHLLVAERHASTIRITGRGRDMLAAIAAASAPSTARSETP